MNYMTWNKESIHEVVERQRVFFKSGKTLPVEWRKRQLRRLNAAMKKYEREIMEALHKDLGRNSTEAYFCDIGTVIAETNEIIAGLSRWAKPELHYSGTACFPSFLTRVYKMPYGVTLIISPFNFPILLSLGVLAASIAGGNTAVIKTSSKSEECTAVLKKIIEDIYPSKYVALIDGGHDVADMCLEERFDKIFYTGSPKVARHVMEMAARNLTPVALELGGETGNWCIVRADADLDDAARKIAFFKLLNSGQICININQVAVAEEVADIFIDKLKAEFKRQIGEDAKSNPEYPHMISAAAYDKCVAEAEEYRDRIVYGGEGNAETLHYNPTIIYPVKISEPIVQHELFSPLLPIIPFRDSKVNSLMKVVAEREHGLSMYLFTRDIRWAKRVMSTQQFGGGCVNEVCLHLMVKGVPFNGTGHSGMGAYHGIYGFREFTHPTTVLFGSRHLNLPLREHPYTGKGTGYKMKLLRIFER